MQEYDMHGTSKLVVAMHQHSCHSLSNSAIKDGSGVSTSPSTKAATTSSQAMPEPTHASIQAILNPSP